MSCPPDGNRGLPIILQGPVTQTQINSMKSPSFIELKAAARTTFPSHDDTYVFDENSATTIRASWNSGETYTLQYVQIFRLFNGSYHPTTNAPIAEFTLWYKSQKSNAIILTCIPIFLKAANNKGGDYLAAALTKDTSYKGSIGDLYGKKSYEYKTCIKYGKDPTNTQGLPVQVIVFLDGIDINSTTNSRFQTTSLKTFGFPAVLLPDISMKTVQRPETDLDTSSGSIRSVYSSLVSTGSDQFTSRFRYYENTFLVSAQEQKKKDASAYKCIPIDTKKNMKMINGKLVVNLEDEDIDNAGTLQDVVNTQKEGAEEVTDVSDAATYVALTIGTLTGAALASGLLWLGFRLILRKTS
jgi:hypothetical protein